MPGRAAQLAIELAERGAEDVAGGLDRVGSAASSMGDKVDNAGRQAEKATSKLDGTAEGADELASKGAQAAGAMGGLGQLIGGPFGAAMQTGGIALQAAADSGDLLNAALENSIVASARSKAATISKTIADKASAVATRGMTIAQKALNLAQKASPLGLIIAGVILLAGALVLAYKRSATFRAIVDKAMSVAKAAVQAVIGVFTSLAGKVADVAGRIRSGVTGAFTTIQDKGDALKDKLVSAFQGARDIGLKAFHALTQPIRDLVDLVQGLIDKISSIHLPHLPHIGNPFNRSTSVTGDSSGGGGSTVNLTLNVTAGPGVSSTDATSTAQTMMDAIDDRLKLIGRTPVFRRA